MQIVIDAYGTSISKKENRFIIKTKEQVQEFAADDVRQILIASPSSLTQGAVELAAEKEIDIVYLDWRGQPYARVYPCKLGGTTLTRKRQLEAYGTERGALFAKQSVNAKIRNQASLLFALAKTRKNASQLSETGKSLDTIAGKINSLQGTVDELRDRLMGLEGSASNQYFTALSSILPFQQREHKANDLVNALLNYGYGILYSEIEKACIIAGLDPYLGFLHTDRYGKPSLVLDLIEEFRQPIVDRSVVTLFVQKQVSDVDAERSGETLFLTKEGRKKMVEAVLSRLHTRLEQKGKRLLYQQIILEQARSLARFFLGETETYKPFVHRW